MTLERMLGIICIIYWLFDFIFNALLIHNFSWLLWYSSAGLLITGIALVTQNEVLLYSSFCALFIIESLWTVDFLGLFIVHKSLSGLTAYTKALNFTEKDLFLTLYHMLIPLSLFYAIRKTTKIYKYGWIGAVLFSSTLAFLTFFLVNPYDRVNCISNLSNCQSIFSFFYKINNPYRIFAALFMLLIFVYLPTNYMVIKVKTKQLKK